MESRTGCGTFVTGKDGTKPVRLATSTARVAWQEKTTSPPELGVRRLVALRH